MTASGTETLTAALRRLADEHASGVLSIATPGRDVLIELTEGLPVGIGPAHDVTQRVGREAGAGVIAAAVVDDLIDRTVAAIVHGGGDWAWNATSDASFMPLPEGLGTELSRRAVDAAQAMAELGDDALLQPGRALETHGEVARIAALFDGRTGLEDVARAAGRPLPAVATIAAALVGAGVLTTGEEPTGPVSWTDAVAAGDDEDDGDDEPELWVMDEPDPEPDPVVEATPTTTDAPVDVDEPVPTAAAGATADDLDTGWDDTTWLDELDTPRPAVRDDDPAPASGDQRAALSSMIGELQSDRSPDRSSDRSPDPAPPTPAARPPAAPPEPAADETPADDDEAAPKRKEPKAQPGEVAEFLRELSRLALDDD